MNTEMQSAREVPVLFLVFNRPAHTAQVFERIRDLQPVRLLISADGPRPDVTGDKESCDAVREIVSNIDWDCTVSTRFDEINLGCRYGPVAGLDWAFQQVEQAIILEDDCLPDQTFFHFCAELLQRYRNNPQVMTIGGHRWEGPDLSDADSYYFSRYPATWGWATWSDRWAKFDIEMREWPDLRDSPWLETLLCDRSALNYWQRIFDSMNQGLDAWDYAWLFSCWRAGAFSIRPNTNLVTNIGFGESATHTHQPGHPASRPASNMNFPLKHPNNIGTEKETEELIEWVNFSGVTTRQVRGVGRHIKARRLNNTSSSND